MENTRSMTEIARELCGSERVGGRDQKRVWWNNQVKAVVKRKEVLGAIDEDARERRLEKEKG